MKNAHIKIGTKKESHNMTTKKEVVELVKDLRTLDEVKNALANAGEEFVDVDAGRVYEALKRKLEKNEKLDLDELDAVAGGYDRNWWVDGCAATCESDSWCWSNDWCNSFEVTYQEFNENYFSLKL